MKFSQKISNLIDCIQKLPNFGKKSAERLAIFLLTKNKNLAKSLATSLNDAVLSLKFCKFCQIICDEEFCDICKDPKRDNGELCIVENIGDLVKIESLAYFKGRYFILGGNLSPIKGIKPYDINFKEFENILYEHKSKIKELILALGSSDEAQFTAQYILEKYGKNFKTSQIGFGIPYGSDLEYLDEKTIFHALKYKTLKS